MNSKKQHLNDKLQKSSLLFLQLGLVLALFLTYTALEFESIKKEFPLAEVVTGPPLLTITPDVTFTIERKVEKIIKEQPKTKSTDDFIKVRDDEPTIEDVLKPTDADIELTIDDRINSLPGDDTEPLEPIIDDIPFEKIEDAPIFPGCEGLDKEASKQCFTNSISKFVNKKFNPDIADGLHGKQRIWVEFKIDRTGIVTDIKARSPYKQLEKEAIRVIKKLPKMTPGKQRTIPVNVKYTLPIVFQTY